MNTGKFEERDSTIKERDSTIKELTNSDGEIVIIDMKSLRFKKVIDPISTFRDMRSKFDVSLENDF